MMDEQVEDWGSCSGAWHPFNWPHNWPHNEASTLFVLDGRSWIELTPHGREFGLHVGLPWCDKREM